jgi:methionyl-tRNA formyltransferase
MKKMSEPIAFFGSGPVAAEALVRLAADFEIEAVITKPQPPHHKETFPVLKVANELNQNVLTTTDKDELNELFKSRPLKSRLGVVIDYGIIIPQTVIDYFPLGIVNSHFSLLPRWRGADPISFAILNGEPETGVSLMSIVEKLDEGPLLDQQPLPIEATDTTPSLTAKLIDLSHSLLTESLPRYLNGEIKPQPQVGEATYSSKLAKQDGWLDFTKPASQLEREVRAYVGWPRSRTRVKDTELVITAASVAQGSGKPGEIWRDGKQFGFYTSEGVLVVTKLIPSGKKEMDSGAFLAGYSLN